MTTINPIEWFPNFLSAHFDMPKGIYETNITLNFGDSKVLNLTWTLRRDAHDPCNYLIDEYHYKKTDVIVDPTKLYSYVHKFNDMDVTKHQFPALWSLDVNFKEQPSVMPTITVVQLDSVQATISDAVDEPSNPYCTKN